MTVSQKQLEANRTNATKGGVKTPEGKAIVKYNALKHGLLAQEAVITVGDGAENPQEFEGLWNSLKTQFAPEGALEEMLVEKVAVAYWRMRRAHRYEVGLIRSDLDNAVEDFYSETRWDHKKQNKTDAEIDDQIAAEKRELADWEETKRDLVRMQQEGKSLEDTYDQEDVWDWLSEKVRDYLPGEEDRIWQPDELRECLNKDKEWPDEDIWQALIRVCEEKIEAQKENIATLTNQKRKNQLRLQVIGKLGNIPSKEELDRLLRYEGAIERQFYKALHQLERLQRLRGGDPVPAPVDVDVNVNTDQGD